MDKLPKLEDFKTPEGYFDQLPDQIMNSVKPNYTGIWLRYAAAITILVCAGTWVFYSPSIENNQLSLEEEVDLYIDSQYWTAEDVLTMADNPEEILDQIINEEFPESTLLWGEENQTWF